MEENTQTNNQNSLGYINNRKCCLWGQNVYKWGIKSVDSGAHCKNYSDRRIKVQTWEIKLKDICRVETEAMFGSKRIRKWYSWNMRNFCFYFKCYQSSPTCWWVNQERNLLSQVTKRTWTAFIYLYIKVLCVLGYDRWSFIIETMVMGTRTWSHL